MPASLLKGVIRGRSVLLDHGAKLPEGTRVVVTPVDAECGSPAAILAAMASAPHLDTKDVDEFERLIEAGKRPLSRRNPLDRKRSKKKR